MTVENQNRLGGIARLYGDEALECFKNAHVAIIGIGGVGSWIAESLARTGVGQITLIDLDEICVTNINRQIHAITETIGHSKTEVMKNRILSINPSCQVNEINDFVGYKNLEDCLTLDYDYIVDAIDLAAIKAAIMNWCKRNKMPAICIGGAGGKIDPSEVKRGDLNRTKNDPLLATVRSQLRAYHGFSRNPKRSYAIECIYSTEQVRYPDGEGGTTFAKPGESMNMDCNTGFGSASHLTGCFAFHATARILERLMNSPTKSIVH